MTKTLLTGIIATLAFSVSVNAEDGDKKGKRAEGKGRPDKEAMEKRRAATKAKILARFDADKDGKLSEPEKKTAHETIGKERKEIHAAVLAKFDTSKDGKLSKDERKGVKEWVKETYPNAIHMGPPHGKRKGGPRGDKKVKKPAAGELGNTGDKGEDCPKKRGGGCKKKKKAE